MSATTKSADTPSGGTRRPASRAGSQRVAKSKAARVEVATDSAPPSTPAKTKSSRQARPSMADKVGIVWGDESGRVALEAVSSEPEARVPASLWRQYEAAVKRAEALAFRVKNE